MKTKTLKSVPFFSFYILVICSGTIFSEFSNEAQPSENINQQKLGTHFKDMTLVDLSVSKSDESLNQRDPNLIKVTYLQGSGYFLQTNITKNPNNNLNNSRANANTAEPEFATTLESSTVIFRSNTELEKTGISLEAMEDNASTSTASETGSDDISVYIVAGVAGAVGLAVVALFIFMVLKVKRRRASRRRSYGNADIEISIPDYSIEPVGDQSKSEPSRTESLEETKLSSRKCSKLFCLRAWLVNLYTVNE